MPYSIVQEKVGVNFFSLEEYYFFVQKIVF